MIPVFSPMPDVYLGFAMQYSPVLPPFTPHTKPRTSQQNRLTTSHWKSRREERFPPLSKTGTAWKDAHQQDDPYTDTMNVLSPTFQTDQNKSFQSTTVLRSVPIMRRHLDSFGGRTFSLPAKTKPVPFHTGRFIFDPHNKPIFFEELTQNQRLLAEIAMVEKVRGLKRKRESIEYRWGWKKLDLYGVEMARGERRNFQAEVEKLKELILPTVARNIYTGRGFRLPETHHTKRPLKQPTSIEPPFPPPPTSMIHHREPVTSKVAPSPSHQSHVQGHRLSITKTARSRDMPAFKQIGPQTQPVTNIDLLVQSVPVPGISSSPVSRPPADRSSGIRSTLDDAPLNPPPQPTPVMKESELEERIEVVEPEPEPVAIDEDPVERIEKRLSPTIAETPIERSRSMAAPSASPDVKPTFNPLVSVSALEDSVTTEDEYEKLKEKFSELDTQNQGFINFEQLLSVCPSNLEDCHTNFLRCLYNVTSQTVPFGPEEFIAMTTLSHKVADLSPSIQVMYEQLNLDTLEESLNQYTELFSSVDRTARGRVGVGALLQILSTTLQRQLEPDTKLSLQIMETIQKEYTSDVSRIEFLVYLPYFLYLEEMT